jgi:hypothetical protein
MSTVVVKLDSGLQIEFEYADLLAVRRNDLELPARIELIVPDTVAEHLIDELTEPHRVLH